MAIRPVPSDHARNRRDDAYADYESLKVNGQVRNKSEKIIDIDEPQTRFSAIDRDRLFQKYCEFMRTGPGESKIALVDCHSSRGDR